MIVLRLMLFGIFSVSVCMAQSVTNSSTVKDADGNVYQAVKIGNQIWTVENLMTTKNNDSTPIPHVTDSAAWVALSTPGYCYYNNTTNADSIKKFGALYNWYAVNTNKLAPSGWHVPTDAEWDTLQNYLLANGYNWDESITGNKMAKSMATKTDWALDTTPGAIGNDLTKNNKSGFSALPGGSHGFNGDWGFVGFGSIGRWWSATEFVGSYAYYSSLRYDLDNLIGLNSADKNCGFSVRLVKD